VIEAPVLVQVERSGMVESRHRGHLVIVEESGAVMRAWGDPDAIIYPRSTVKPLQALGMLEAGLALDGSQLAVACASHSAEPFHLEAVRAILAGVGLAESSLQCPADLPYAEPARRDYLAAGGVPARVVMNCSGKHAAMLATCLVNGWPLETYLDPAHPLQVHLRQVIERMAGACVGVTSADGCGAPLWALPLVGLARAFVQLALAGPQVAASMRDYPDYSGGTTRDVTHLMRAVPGLVAKDGAESVQAMVLERDGRRFGIALKIEDGAQRARPVAAAAALATLGVVGAVLDEHRCTPVLGGGRPVGRVRPVPGVF
jgi:L-asparaginase II